MQEDATEGADGRSGRASTLGKRKIGLALSSGMARGWAHIGALRALGAARRAHST